MSRYYAHFKTAKHLISVYDGQIPFAAFIKTFFSKEKKYGSKDRKNIAGLCYNYYRLGNLFADKSIEDRLSLSLFLGNHSSNEYLIEHQPDWNDAIGMDTKQKLELAGVNIKALFPFNDELSKEIDATPFGFSYLLQPKLFVRIRPNKRPSVLNKLNQANLNFQVVSENCISFENGTKLDEILKINDDVVIQDYSSQLTGSVFSSIQFPRNPSVWDCCAASGGKSIMAVDILGHIQLTVSDLRMSILKNLIKRFREAGIELYQSFVADLSVVNYASPALIDKGVDFVICDAPCSGSGTWGRTPEQLSFFKKEEIVQYCNLQKTIADNAIKLVKKGGYFLYITCYVFAKENEDVVSHIQEYSSLTMISQQYLKGYDVQADTLFAALFRNDH